MDGSLRTYFDEFTRRDWQTLDPERVSVPVRIAIVGLGWFSREWALPGIQRSAFTEATVVTDIDPETVDAVATEHDLTGVTPEEFTTGRVADEYDAVYIATPNATHLDYVECAAEQGKAVLCEKPMEATLDRAERVVETCETHDVPLMVGYRMQTDPAVRRVKNLLEEGFIGDVVHVHAAMSQTMLGELSTATDQWRLDPALSGGCALMDLGVYPLNTTRFVLDADPERVTGHTRSEHAAFERVDEHASFDLHFPDGVRAHCTVSQNAQHASRLEITGMEGQLTVRRGEMEADIEFDPVHQIEAEFAYFGHHLRTDTPFFPDGSHALVDMRVLDTVYESAETGEPVSVTD
jgi:xylose dehydrogenase (NAD/NADP)